MATICEHWFNIGARMDAVSFYSIIELLTDPSEERLALICFLLAVRLSSS